MSRNDYILLHHSYVFVLKLRESLISSSVNIQKDCKIHVEVPENY